MFIAFDIYDADPDSKNKIVHINPATVVSISHGGASGTTVITTIAVDDGTNDQWWVLSEPAIVARLLTVAAKTPS